jgi:hypothetical protein
MLTGVKYITTSITKQYVQQIPNICAPPPPSPDQMFALSQKEGKYTYLIFKNICWYRNTIWIVSAQCSLTFTAQYVMSCHGYLFRNIWNLYYSNLHITLVLPVAIYVSFGPLNRVPIKHSSELGYVRVQ